MAWPKGKSRKVEAAHTSDTDVPVAKESGPRKWKMRAQANWETMNLQEDSPDRFHIAPTMIPEGMSLQWVTDSVYGQLQPQHRADFEKRGWTPVHQDDFDARFDGMFMPKGQDGEINNGGQVLMARPAEITKAARDKEIRDAKQQLALKEAALRGGDIPGVSLDTQHQSVHNKVSRSWERMAVPTDE